MAFWSNITDTTKDPKRNFRFKITISSIKDSIWYAKTCDKPSFTIETLRNAFITEAKFGSLEYGSDDLTTLDLTLQYDWATCDTSGNSGTSATHAGADTKFFDKTSP